jgi:hypothetical protein
MARAAARREKRTLAFKAGGYGHTDVKDSVTYVRMLRRRARRTSDESFLKEVRAWQRAGGRSTSPGSA